MTGSAWTQHPFIACRAAREFAGAEDEGQNGRSLKCEDIRPGV